MISVVLEEDDGTRVVASMHSDGKALVSRGQQSTRQGLARVARVLDVEVVNDAQIMAAVVALRAALAAALPKVVRKTTRRCFRNDS